VMSSSTIAITKSHYERGKGAPLLDLGATTTTATGWSGRCARCPRSSAARRRRPRSPPTPPRSIGRAWCPPGFSTRGEASRRSRAHRHRRRPGPEGGRASRV